MSRLRVLNSIMGLRNPASLGKGAGHRQLICPAISGYRGINQLLLVVLGVLECYQRIYLASSSLVHTFLGSAHPPPHSCKCIYTIPSSGMQAKLTSETFKS
jgi:hypothetical protein